MALHRPVIAAAGLSALVSGELMATVPNWISPSTLIAIGAIVAFVFTPLLDRSIIAALKRNRPVVKEFLQELFAAEIAEQRRVGALASANADTLEFILVSVKAQSVEMPKFSAVAERLTIAVETLTETCERISEDGRETKEIAVRLEERVQALKDQREEDFRILRSRGQTPARAADNIKLDP